MFILFLHVCVGLYMYLCVTLTTPRCPGLTMRLVHYLLNGDFFFTLAHCELNLATLLVYQYTETHPYRVSLS